MTTEEPPEDPYDDRFVLRSGWARLPFRKRLLMGSALLGILGAETVAVGWLLGRADKTPAPWAISGIRYGIGPSVVHRP